MYLVHQNKHRDGKWEVAWMWLPHFLSADESLRKYIDQKMTEAFKGEVVAEETKTQLIERMHNKVIDLLVERYPFRGMRKFLETYDQVWLSETES